LIELLKGHCEFGQDDVVGDAGAGIGFDFFILDAAFTRNNFALSA